MKIKIISKNNGITSKIIPNRFKVPVPMGEKASDIKTVAEAIFAVEDALHDGIDAKEVFIPVYGSYNTLSEIIEDLFMFLFSKQIKVKFIANEQQKLKTIEDTFSNDLTSLFSGGVDSFSGILNSNLNSNSKVVGAFTLHEDQKISKLIKLLQIKSLVKYGIEIKTIQSQRHYRYNRLTRGLLYILNAILLKNRNIVVPECGITMYQPKFTILDSINMTTHPRIMQMASDVIKEVWNDVTIIKPNENLTKAEVAACCPDKEYITKTCSCINTMFCNARKSHEGTCYGCVVRRLSLIVAGINEDGKYRNDLFFKKGNGSMQINNALALIDFALDCLNNSDSLSWYSWYTIKEYRKEKLFERFSKDVIAALFLINQRGKLLDNLFRKKLEIGLKTISKDQLQNRIEEVRSQKFKPDFSLKL